jgi:dihydroorotase
MQLVIKNGHVIDPANQRDEVTDIYIIDERIAAIGKAPKDFKADKVIDARNLMVIPGLIDISVKLNKPGDKNKGNIASESKAAATGGITTMCVQPDTDPVIDTPAIADMISRTANDVNQVRILTIAALTAGLAGERLAEMALLRDRGGCIGVSNGDSPVKNILVMRRAMEYAASCRMQIYLHANEPSLSKHGCAHEGVISTRLGLKGIPDAAETIAVARELMLIEQTGVSAHFLHISSHQAASLIAHARQEGLPVSMSVTPHHLHLTEMDIGYFNSQCHVLPPLRTQRDRDALRQAVSDGSISCISSDHRPLPADAKLAPFGDSVPGISGLETLLALTLRLVDEKVLSLNNAIARLTQGPADTLGLKDCGQLSVGYRADICIFDAEQSWSVERQSFVSSGKNSPFNDWEVKGKVKHTILAGEPVYDAVN